MTSRSSCQTLTGLGSRMRLMPQYAVPRYQRTSRPRTKPTCTDAAQQLVAPVLPRAHRAGACRRRLLDRLADFLVQQLIERVAEPAELLRGDEGGPARMRLVDRNDLLDAAGPRREHRDAVGQEHRLAERMGDEHDGLLAGGEQHRQILAEDHAGLLVERAERLVHQQRAGLKAERAGERRALAHAARQLRRIVPHEVAEARPPPGPCAPAAPARPSARPGTPCRA